MIRRLLLCFIFTVVVTEVSSTCFRLLKDENSSRLSSDDITPICKHRCSCQWNIDCPLGQNVSLTFDEVQINCSEGNFSMMGPLPAVRAAASKRSMMSDSEMPYHGFCGSYFNKTFISVGSYLILTLDYSNATNNIRFNATWKCVKPVVPTSKPTVPSTVMTTTELPTTVKLTTQRSTTKIPGSYCKFEVVGDIEWPDTLAGTTQRQFCAGMSNGYAYRYCHIVPGFTAEWDEFINQENCTSAWLSGVVKKIEDDNILIKDTTLSLKGATTSSVESGDLLTSMLLLGQLNSKTSNQINKEQSAIKLGQDYTIIASNYLGAATWNGIPKNKQTEVATGIIRRLEQFLQIVAKSKTHIAKPEIIFSNTASEYVVTSLQRIETSKMKDENIDLVSDKVINDAIRFSADWNGLSKVEIPQEIIKQASNQEKYVTSSFVATRNFSRLIHWNETNAEALLNTKPDNSTNATSFINTHLVTVSLQPSLKENFSKPAQLSMVHLKEIDPKSTVAKCVFWNETLSDWSDEGVITKSVDSKQTICETNHFTSFAVIMMTRHVQISEQHTLALSAISLIGISVSLVSLVLAFSVFVNCRSLQSTRNTIHKNLVASLGLSYVFFIVGITRTENKLACSIFAAILYYFLMVAILWMLMEGIQLYVMLVQVFPKEGLKKHYYVVCWGLPAVFAIVGWGIFREGFYNKKYCWLSFDNHFIWAFVGPAILVFAINMVFLIMTFRIILRNAPIIADQESTTTATTIKYWAKGSLGLLPLLGVTWLFGLLFLSSESIVMAYLFNICNAFQGLYIFVFYCILNDKVKEEFHRRIWSSFSSSSGGTTFVKDTKTGNRSPSRSKQASTFFYKQKNIRDEAFQSTEDVDQVTLNMGKENLSTFAS